MKKINARRGPTLSDRVNSARKYSAQKMKMFLTLSALLLCLICALAFAACSGDKASDSTTSGSPGTGAASAGNETTPDSSGEQESGSGEGQTSPVEEKVVWRFTTNSDRWVDGGELEFDDSDDLGSVYVKVDQTVGYQVLDELSWGGCFAERGWRAMENLTDEQRTEILEALFGDEGLRLNFGRTPIAANDYAITHYSYDETPDDYNMENFSIAQDEKYLIPYIMKAMEVKPGLKLWASPWSPPSWVKTNNSLIGGQIDDTPENLQAYALYFSKYLDAYKEKGIDIYMVMPQNEPTMNTAYTSCVWSGEQLNVFIRDYLAPTLAEKNPGVDIWLGTFTDSDSTRVDPALNDEKTREIIKGVAFQWWGKQKAASIYRSNTGLLLMQSETMCGDGQNNWQYAEDQFDLIKGYFESGVNAYCLWNMVLDEKGANTAASPWYQNAPITVNSSTNEISYNPQYYLFKHFSYYVEPGARRLKTESKGVDSIAFQNKNGDNVLIVKNGTALEVETAVDFNGRTVRPVLKPHSINTFVIPGNVTVTEDMIYSEGDSGDAGMLSIKLINAASGRALTVQNGSLDNGADLILYDNQGMAEQIWIMDKTDSGTFKMVNSKSFRLIGVWAGDMNAGARIVQWDDDGSNNQQWTLEKTEVNGKTYYKIVNFGSGKLFGPVNGGTENSTKIVQQNDTGDFSQLWEVVYVSGDESMLEE